MTDLLDRNLPSISISGTEIQQIAYKGEPVVTFAMVDEVHQRPAGTASRNFRENRERFVEGTDFIKISADEIRRHNIIDLSPMAREDVHFLTQRGYLKLTKPMNDDRAWQVQGEMVDVYFAAHAGVIAVDGLPLPKKLKAVGDVMSGFSRLIGLLGVKGNQRAISAAQATYRETGVNVLELTGITHLKAEVQEQTLNPTEIGQRLTPIQKPAAVNQALSGLGLQSLHRYRVKGKNRSKWELTDAGKATGAHYDDTAKRHMSGTSVLSIKWTANVIPMVQAHFDNRR